MQKKVRVVDDEQLRHGKPLTGLVCIKNWDDERQRWVGVVCQVLVVNGEQGIVVHDINTAETQVEIDDWGKETIATRPWEKE